MKPASRRLCRARVVRAYDRGDATTFIGIDGDVFRAEGDSAGLLRAILEFLSEPRTEDELSSHLADLSGLSGEDALDHTGAIADAVALLERVGAVVSVGDVAATKAPVRVEGRRLLLAISGGVAAAYAPLLIELLQARGFEVRACMTRNARRFVAPLAIEALTHAPAPALLWPTSPSAPVPHLDLAAWAELVVVYPATAATIARIAQGRTSDLVAAVAISTRAPVVIVPSMNSLMRSAPSVQRNLEQLQEDGFLMVHCASGIEVADKPGERAPSFGPAPPVAAVADIALAIATHEVSPRKAAARTSAEAWDATYQSTRPDDLAWHVEGLDADVADLLTRVAPSGRLLDLGTGLGSAAISASDRGYSVVAVDVSARALAIAEERAALRPITWIVDDVLATRVSGRFDVVLDRGCLHTLGAADQSAYVASVASKLLPGGWLMLKAHGEGAPGELGTHRFSRPELEALFAEAFELVSLTDSTFPGPGDRAPHALLAALRRR